MFISKTLVRFLFCAGLLASASVQISSNSIPQNPDAEAALGYNPSTGNPDDIPAPTTNPHKKLLIIAHGFGDRAHRFNLQNSDSAAVVSFHFRDSRINQQLYNFWWRNINLGQDGDIRALLYHLIQGYRAGYRIISLFGHSRGGATCINTLYVFEHPELFPKIWDGLGTSYEELARIRQALKRGTIFLARPLMSVDAALTQALGSFRHLAPWITSYDAQKTEPIDIFKKLVNENCGYTFKIFLAAQDGVVTDRHNAELKSMNSANVIVTEITPSCLVKWFEQLLEHQQPKPWQLQQEQDLQGFRNQIAKNVHIYIPEAIAEAKTYLAKPVSAA